MLSLKEYKEEYGLPTSLCLNLTDSCNLRCRYCMPASTKILMGDGAIKDISDIQEGDLIFGCQEEKEAPRKQRKLKITKVLKTSNRLASKLLKITMEDGKELLLTPEHPVLNGRGQWTQAKNLRAKTGMIMSLGYNLQESYTDIYNIDYIKGYFLGMWLTDGMHEHYKYPSGDIYSMRIAVKDDEIISRMKEYCNILNFSYTTRDFLISEKEQMIKEAIFSSKKESFDYINQMDLDFRLHFDDYLKNDNWVKGFLAATYDAEGHIDLNGHVVSISNADEDILYMWEFGLQKFGFEIKRDIGEKKTNLIVFRSRLLTQNYPTLQKQMELFNLIKPAVTRKTFKALEDSCPLTRNRILKIEEIKEETRVYNLETDQHTFIANGLAVHNCFVNQKPNFMTLDTAKAAVDYLMKNVYRKREIYNDNNIKGTINFFGGEPMLLYDEIIVPLTLYIESKYSNEINLGITTNGTLLNKERIDFLYDHKILPLLSMDGDRETQEYNRPCTSKESSFNLVEKNIPYLLEKFPNTTFRMTIYEDTCDKLFRNILYAERMGFKRFYCIPDSRHNFSEENMIRLKLEIKKFYDYFILSLTNFHILPIEGNLVEEGFLNALIYPSISDKIDSSDIMTCGLGTVSAAVGPDGSIYGCQEQVTYGKTGNIFYIGDIYSGIDKTKHLIFLNSYRSIKNVKNEDNKDCLNCKYFKICSITCPSAAMSRFGNFFTKSKTFCDWDTFLLTTAQEYLKIENKDLKLYLNYLITKEE